MSAWYIFATLGFYPVAGTTRYLLGSPIFESVVIQRPQGPLSIIAHGAAPANMYVQKCLINGVAVDMRNAPWIDHAQIAIGGATLEFWMGPDIPPGVYEI